MEISVRAYLTAMGREDNCRGEYLDYEDAEDAVARLLMGSQFELLGWQQLESAQPKKMVLSGDHFWSVALWHLMWRWTDRRRSMHDVGGNARNNYWSFLNLLR